MGRCVELDWLRVLLVLAVFAHHALMPFNGDNWHIMNADSSKLLDDIMVFFEQLRLPSLFFIAGAGSTLLLAKVSAIQFSKDKIYRLLLPLLVGILFVVPPQTYIESQAEYESTLSAIIGAFSKFETNHLWFIEYLVLFSFLAILINRLLNSSFGSNLIVTIQKISARPYGLFSLVLILIIIRLTLSNLLPEGGESYGKVASMAFYFFFFSAGMLFIRSPTAWSSMSRHKSTHLKCFLASSATFYLYYFSPDLSPYLSESIRWSIWWLVCSLVTWSGLLTLFGFAQQFFKATPGWLKVSNQLIYPFYIFHQTVIILLGYFIIDLNWTLTSKAWVLLLTSFLITSGICLYVIRPYDAMRFLFGLKPSTS